MRSRSRGARPAPTRRPGHQVDRRDQLLALERWPEAMTTGCGRGRGAGGMVGFWARVRRVGDSRAASYHRLPLAARRGRPPIERCRGVSRESEDPGRVGRRSAAARRLPVRRGHGGLPDRGVQRSGQPANNCWPGSRRPVTPSATRSTSGGAEQALDRAAALGCDSFRLGASGRACSRTATASTRGRSTGTWPSPRPVSSGADPLVTLHHFTTRSAGEDLWLRPTPWRARGVGRIVVPALAPTVRHWVTLNEINVMALSTYLLGRSPGRLAASVTRRCARQPAGRARRAYDVIHAERPTRWSRRTTSA